MHRFLRSILKSTAYVAAALVILLALAVGLFRLMLPQLPEYQERIKDWANAAIGMQVQFEDMDARWRLSGPELTFRNAELTPYDSVDSLLSAGEVSVSVSLLRLLRDRVFVVGRIAILRTNITLQRSENDGWLVQGRPLSTVIGSREIDSNQGGEVVVIATDVEVEYLLPDSSETLAFTVDNLNISRDKQRLKIDATIELPESVGNRLDVSAVQRLEEAEHGIWQFYVEGNGLEIPGAMRVDETVLPQFQSGTLNLSASMQGSSAGIQHVTADFVISNLAGVQSTTLAPIDAQGRLEYSSDTSGWLLAGSNFVLSTVDASWPRTTLSVKIAEDQDGALQSVTAATSFLNFDDIHYLVEWLPEDVRQQFELYDPSGVLRDVRFSLDAMQSSEPRFDVALELSDAGVAATDRFPGVRNLTGLLRANSDGGRFEVSAAGVVLDMASQLAEPIAFDDAIGTIIWRRNAQGTTLLSDSVRVRNADFDSNSSLQMSFPADGGAPVVDFESNWSINDVSAVGRYLPAKKIKPGLYKWLSDALVAGRAPYGTMLLSGPLDRFPFDNGEGVFRIEGHLEDTTLRYATNWPVADNMTLDVVLDGMRLYSTRNSASNAGNSVVDARLEISDLRKPLLEIDAFSTGSLASIKKFSQESPIASLFGGHLENVSVDGDASFSLQLSLPILNKDDYAFETRIQISDGTLAFAGFPAPLTELNGVVSINREAVRSEMLFGTFLGEAVDLELRPAGEQQPSYSVVAEASGRLAKEGLVAELAPGLDGFLRGSSEYSAVIRFPKPGAGQPVPLEIGIGSSLDGMSIDLPAPLSKSASESLPIDATIEFPEPGRISTYGNAGTKLTWAATFRAPEGGGWDFDRGSLAIGGIYPEIPETRGLHIIGETDAVDFDDWLAVARRGGGGVGIADRIRSIDLSLGHLYILGQDLQDHRVQVQRSAQDWFVSISGKDATGTVTVPYDFDSGRPLIAEMESLVLPGRDEVSEGASDATQGPDPRSLPPVTVFARDFALGDRNFGELDAEFSKTVRGLESTRLATRDASFTIDGSAGWLYNAGEPYTYFDAKLSSTDIRATMDRLNYQPGISGDLLQIDFQVRWPGPPREDFMEQLAGAVRFDTGSGQLDDVEPGAGRVFGLMSIVALPRRLSLDFTDVFDRGFGFDRITGSFRIENGQAYTCDLSLEGPAADVGIVGRAGLATRDYSQTAIVSANVGNTLPVIGAVIAGPQVAAALLVFSQIFKKPLQDIGQVYYGIDGSWDEPAIVNADASRFAENSGAAGCF